MINNILSFNYCTRLDNVIPFWFLKRIMIHMLSTSAPIFSDSEKGPTQHLYKGQIS